jgi:hypothetical protein
MHPPKVMTTLPLAYARGSVLDVHRTATVTERRLQASSVFSMEKLCVF